MRQRDKLHTRASQRASEQEDATVKRIRFALGTHTHIHIRQTHTHSEIFLRGNATLPLESPSSSFARKHFTLCQAISYFFFGLFSISAPLLLRSPLHTHTHTAWLVKFVDLRVCSVSLVYLFLAGLLAPALTSSHWSGESSPKSKERRAWASLGREDGRPPKGQQIEGAGGVRKPKGWKPNSRASDA